jgi:hypothetical protein
VSVDLRGDRGGERGPPESGSQARQVSFDGAGNSKLYYLPQEEGVIQQGRQAQPGLVNSVFQANAATLENFGGARQMLLSALSLMYSSSTVVPSRPEGPEGLEGLEGPEGPEGLHCSATGTHLVAWQLPCDCSGNC